MKKYNLSKIMKRAWEIKKEDNKNIFAICLKMAWEEAKKGVKKMTVEEYLVEKKGLKVWEKYGKKRIYINDLTSVDIDKYTSNPKSYRRASMYYDINEDKFVYSCSSSIEADLIACINGIRESAKVA